MHRELSHIDEAFRRPSHAGLYALTALVGLLIGLDLGWTVLAQWSGSLLGLDLPRLEGGFTLPFFTFKVRFVLVAALVGGARIVLGALESLAAGKLGADLALALAVLAAIMINEPLVAAEVVFIGLVGECLEAVTFDRTQSALRRLAEVCPRVCWLMRDGEPVKTPIEELRVGDHVLVRPGKRIPVDGVVVDGRSAVDESALTGESLPVDKEAGASVFAGTLNQHGALVLSVQRVAEHTIVGQVLKTTAQALREKASLERTADRMARYFLPVVLGLTLLTYVGNFWWLRATPGALYQAAFPALAVLVVACPCALILATPAAIIAALGRLAGTGVLVKSGAALERLARVDVLAFDKTGTLTTGRVQLGEVVPLTQDVTPSALLQLAATAEQRSEHPLGQLVVQAAKEQGIVCSPLDEFVAHPGAGVVARVGSDVIRVGNRRFLEGEGITLPPEGLAALDQLDAGGESCLIVARNAVAVGVIGARDSLRPEASAVVDELRRLGVKTVALLTGDRSAAARVIADQLDIAEVHAEMLPAHKASWVEQRKASGSSVAMVGDGINDAPALASATVGLALGGVGTDIAAEAGDLVLMGDPLRPLPLLFRLSRKTVEIIRQNILIFAFGVNLLGIVLTAWLMPAWSDEARQQSPLFAALYHQVGSLAVLLNAMRLLGFERGNDFAAVRGYRKLSERVDAWLEHLTLHDFIHWVEGRWKRLLAGLVAVVLIAYLLSGFTVIRPEEVGLVQRFGRLLPDDLTPGLHYRFPWPWERVTRVQPQEVKSVDVGFRAVGASPSALTWASPHADGILKEKEEGLMMTGDGNLVEVQARVYYTVGDPRTYAFGVADGEGTLRALTESVLREIIAERAFLSLLAQEREKFQQAVTTRLRQRCEQEYPLGVTLQTVAIQDLHPPQDVVDSYYAVTRALTQKDRMLSEAQRERETSVSREIVARKRLEALARGGFYGTTELTRAERDAFLALANTQGLECLRGFVLPSPGPSQALGVSTALVLIEDRMESEDLRQQLTGFRLHLETAEQVLGGRPKVVRDPTVRGQLHVMPEMLKFRLPFLGRDPEVRTPMPAREGSGEGP